MPAFVGVWIVVTQILDMRLIGSIMDKFMSVGLLILVILFQDEIKRFLVQLGSHKRWRFFFNFFLKHKDTGEKPYIMPIVHACMNMSKTKTGALIVIEQGVSLDNYKNTGDTINANVNARLIENIFFHCEPKRYFPFLPIRRRQGHRLLRLYLMPTDVLAPSIWVFSYCARPVICKLPRLFDHRR